MVNGAYRNLGLVSRSSQYWMRDLQTTWRPDHCWPEIWSGMSTAAQRREKQQWAFEKPKLDTARKLRGISFIDPEDTESRETMKNARKSWNCLWNQPRPARSRPTTAEPCDKESATPRSKYACIVEAHESTRRRLERTQPKDDEDRIAGKGFNSLSHFNLVHKFIPMLQAMKIPHAKAAVDNRKSKEQFILLRRWTTVISKNAELEPKIQKYKGRVVLRGDIVKDDSGSYATFTEQGSSASQMKTEKVMDIYQGYQDVQDKLPTQYRLISKSTWRTLEHYVNLPSQSVQTFGNVYHNASDTNLGQTSKTQLFILSEICMVTHLPDIVEKTIWKVLLRLGWETVPNWKCLFVHRKQILFLSLWKKLMKLVDLGELTSFLTTCTWDALNVNANRTKLLLMNTETCSNHESPPEQLKDCLVGRNRTRTRSLGLMTWKVMRRNAWNDTANWQMKRFSNCTTSLHHVQVCAWMENSLSISGTWLLKYYILHWINLVSRETCAAMSNQENERTNTRTKKTPQLGRSQINQCRSCYYKAQNFLTSAPLRRHRAVINMMIKGSSPTLRHVSRTGRVALDWLFKRINLDPKNPNQLCWYQKPTCRYPDERQFYP